MNIIELIAKTDFEARAATLLHDPEKGGRIRKWQDLEPEERAAEIAGREAGLLALAAIEPTKAMLDAVTCKAKTAIWEEDIVMALDLARAYIRAVMADSELYRVPSGALAA